MSKNFFYKELRIEYLIQGFPRVWLTIIIKEFECSSIKKKFKFLLNQKQKCTRIITIYHQIILEFCYT